MNDTIRPFVREAALQAVQSLLAQSKFGVNTFGSCVYYGGGLSCAAGLLFRNLGVAPTTLEDWGGSVRAVMGRPDLVQALPEQWRDLSALEVSFLQGLQSVHDRAARYGMLGIRAALRQAAESRITACSEDYIGYDDAHDLYLEVLNA